MGTVKAESLLKQWKLDEMSLEQGLGHTLQHLVLLYQQLQRLETDLRKLQTALSENKVNLTKLRADVDALIAHTQMPPVAEPRQTARRKSSKKQS